VGTSKERLSGVKPTSLHKAIFPATFLAGIAVLATVNHLIAAQTRSTEEPVGSTAAPVTVPDSRLPDQRYADNPRAASKRVERIARESGGDWNKVAPDDQRLLDSMTLGRGKQMLRLRADELQRRAHGNSPKESRSVGHLSNKQQTTGGKESL
jgi:hypothetical protein